MTVTDLAATLIPGPVLPKMETDSQPGSLI